MRRLMLFLLFQQLTCLSIAQSTQPAELHFNRLTLKNGLPEDVIISYLQDKEGYMWATTQAGLVRYDGYGTKVYQFGLKDPIHATVINIYEDRSGELWVGSLLEGLFQYDRVADTFIQYKHNPKDTNSIGAGLVSSINGDRNGNIWITLADEYNFSKPKYLNLLDTKKHVFKHFSILEKGTHYVSATEFTNFFEDEDGRIWIGTNNGFYEYLYNGDYFVPHLASTDPSKQKTILRLQDEGTRSKNVWLTISDTKTGRWEGLLRFSSAENNFKAFHHNSNDPSNLGSDSVYQIKKDSRGQLWFGMENGLALFDPLSERFSNYILNDQKGGPHGNQIWIIKEDKSGNLWCGNYNNELYFDTKAKSFTRYTFNEKDPGTLANASVNDLYVDQAGTLWVETVFQGLCWVNLNRSKFVVFQNNPAEIHHFPGGGSNSFVEDKNGTFWVWSSHGLYHWYPAKDSFVSVKGMNNQGGKTPFNFSSVLIDSKGIIWCNAFGIGIFSYDPKSGRISHFQNEARDSTSLSENRVTCIYEDKKGTIWVGTMGGGLCSYDREGNNFKRYPYVNNVINTPNNGALDDAVVFCIYEDRQGTLWVGTNNGGLNRFDPASGTFTSYQNQLPGFMTISSIFEDSRGQFWVGTHVGGLFLFDRKTNTAKRFTEKDGLLYDGTLAMNEDQSGRLWITSARGISILDIQTHKIARFTLGNGLAADPENNLNLFKTSRGRFLMPAKNGFVYFDPDQLKADSTVPIVHIESMEITRPQLKGMKQEDSLIYLYGKNKINLRYNENRISFNYVGLQYQNSALNQYAYKLDGYDNDWIQAGTQRKVTYTNLSPKEYVFHVKAANPDGVWNEKEQTLTVVISPPWWLTWWAYLMYAIAIAIAVWAFAAYRSRRLISQNLILEGKIAQRTGQLKKSLEDLTATQTQLIQSEKMASLGELTAGIAHEIQNPLNFVNNFSEVNAELIDELKNELRSGNHEQAISIAEDIRENEQKIMHHGNRADAIVKGMLQHSRSGSSQKELTDINALAEEYLRLSYHGLRAKDKAFNANLETHFDESIGKIEIFPQDIGRGLLNLYNNAFYAVTQKKNQREESRMLQPGSPGQDDQVYEPTVSVRTVKLNGKVEIRVRDNGRGIPQKLLDKIFQPFFTTKPTGQGTGLGLSLTYDIVTKEHGGEIKVETAEGQYTEFIVLLPA